MVISVIPIMTSNNSPSGTASASSIYDATRPAWRGFNKNRNDAWLSQYSSGTVQTNQWLRYNFDTPKKVIKYSLSVLSGTATEQWQVGTAPKSWRYEASNNGIDWVILDEKTNFSKELWVADGGYKEFSIVNEKFYLMYRLYLVSYQYSGATYFQINELDMYIASEHMLVKNERNFLNYVNNQFNRLSLVEPVSEVDYLSYGMDDISIIPESAWAQLEGEVELCYFTDDPNKTEVSFNIETEPFTLAEEWEDKEIKIIEYTDDPNQTESTIIIETEPFTLYDELGDTVDVLYYTDDPTKTSAALNITANYSPLDELEGDFDVVTWTNDEDVIAGTRDMSLTYDALPFEQIIVQPTDIELYGDLKKLVASKIVDSRTKGTLKLAASFDSGLTWKTYRFDKWVTLDIQNTTLFKRKGMGVETLNTISEQDLTGLTRVAYYLDNSEHYENSYALDQLKMVVDAPRQTVEVQQMALQLLNTTATIELTFSGNKLQGILNDADKGKVKYRVLLNGQSYYPADGEFTRLLPSPFKIEINIDERKFLFGKENTLKVEFQDYWGTVDAREFGFVGTYSGLMFMDESGDFLSDTFGGILKQLDYEVIIAGQTTLTKKVKLKNQLGYAVDHVYLEMDKKFQTSGVEVQLSRQADPFLPIDYLTYGLMKPEESIDFYVRIATDIHAKPDPNGIFEMKVMADRV